VIRIVGGIGSGMLRARIYWMLVVAGCDAQAYQCRAAEECTLTGEAGLCLDGSCAYPDDACPSGYRYAAGLGSALAGECVSPDDAPHEDDDEGPMPQGGTSSSSSSSTTRGADPTSSSGSEESTGEPASTTGVEEASTTTGDNGTPPGESSSSTGTAVACDQLDCDECFECVIEDGGACAMLEGECEAATECSPSAACMYGCAMKGLCFYDCCDGIGSEDATMAHDLHVCRAEACAAACNELPEPPCSG
jgi:hypothetical protein